jgi:short-subunit dehydrogenase involved in D-alanine esterification of teichoic acids
VGELAGLLFPGHQEQPISSNNNNIIIIIINKNNGDSNGDGKGNTNNYTDANIIHEIMLNLTAPMIIARHLIPHLQSLSRPTHFLITGSGLGFVPLGMMAVYSATKDAVHAFVVGLRESLASAGSDQVNVIELVVPYVRTDLARVVPGSMQLEEFTD